MRIPKLRRKTLPFKVKAEVLAAQARCASCGEKLIDLKLVRFDHRPPLFIRPYSISAGDYEPPQNEPACIEALHHDCHQWRTSGRKPGAAKTATTVGSDLHTAAKIKRMNKPKKPRRKIRSRGFPKQRREFPR